MSFSDALKIFGAGVFSVGSAFFIIFCLSSWLGKVWAQRILKNEEHQLDLEIIKVKNELSIIKEQSLKFHNEKIVAYKEIADMVARLLAKLDSAMQGRLKPDEMAKSFDEFNEQRIRVYGYLGMFAPQSVMDAQDELVDYLLLVLHNNEKYEWELVRKKALKLVNAVRMDIGIEDEEIRYNGYL